MRKGVLATMAAVMFVSGCATVRESRVNPLNWFGRSEAAAPVAGQPRAKVDDRLQIAEVTALSLEQTNSGAILKVTGLPPTQGWYKAELVAEPTETEGEVVYRFYIEKPEGTERVGSPHSREITAALFLNEFRLAEISTITVTGMTNSRSIRRR